MVRKKIPSVGSPPKSKADIILDLAIQKHANNPDIVNEFERMRCGFRKRFLCGEILDLPAALQQLERESNRIGALDPLSPKSPKPKTRLISKGTWIGHSVAAPRQTPSLTKKSRKRVSPKHRVAKTSILGK